MIEAMCCEKRSLFSSPAAAALLLVKRNAKANMAEVCYLILRHDIHST